MKETNNYKLNQWELTDRVRMEDFNADNLKIENALLGKLSGMQVVDYWESTGKIGGTIGSNFPQVDWNEIDSMLCLFHFPAPPEGTRLGTFDFCLNGIGSPKCEVATLAQEPFLVLLLPLFDSSRKVEGVVFADRLYYFKADFTFDKLNNYTLLRPSGLMDPSSVFFGMV